MTRLKPQHLAVPLVVATWVLVVFGSTVRAHQAGLACPDWPMCFGEVLPPIDFEIWLEFGHRALAGAVSIVFVGLGVWLGVTRRLRGALGLLYALAAVLLATQVVLGGLTVLELLAEWTVVSHLLTGNSFAAVLLLIALTLLWAGQPVLRAPVGHRVAVAALTGLFVLQAGLGGWVAGAEAGTACGPVWPECAGSGWFPTFAGTVGIQVIHRTVAYVLVLAAIGAFAYLRSARAGLFLVLVLVQACIGIANVLASVPVELTVLHSAGAAALFAVATWWNAVLWRRARPVGLHDFDPQPAGAALGSK